MVSCSSEFREVPVRPELQPQQPHMTMATKSMVAKVQVQKVLQHLEPKMMDLAGLKDKVYQVGQAEQVFQPATEEYEMVLCSLEFDSVQVRLVFQPQQAHMMMRPYSTVANVQVERALQHSELEMMVLAGSEDTIRWAEQAHQPTKVKLYEMVFCS